jgi:hypothetical protein
VRVAKGLELSATLDSHRDWFPAVLVFYFNLFKIFFINRPQETIFEGGHAMFFRVHGDFPCHGGI